MWLGHVLHWFCENLVATMLFWLQYQGIAMRLLAIYCVVSRALPDGCLLCLLYSDPYGWVTSSIKVYGIFHPFSCLISQKSNDTSQSTLNNNSVWGIIHVCTTNSEGQFLHQIWMLGLTFVQMSNLAGTTNKQLVLTNNLHQEWLNAKLTSRGHHGVVLDIFEYPCHWT